MFLASKYEEMYAPEIGDFVYITDNSYNKKQILDMEIQMLKTMGFQLGRPLPIHFLRRYSKAAGVSFLHWLGIQNLETGDFSWILLTNGGVSCVGRLPRSRFQTFN